MRRALHSLLLVLLLSGSDLYAQPWTPFTEEAAVRGLTVVPPSIPPFGTGVALHDLDGDGDLDVVVTAADIAGATRVYENTGGGVFIPGPSSGLPVDLSVCSVSAADYDADGDLDLYLGSWGGPDRLLRNDGGLSFTDVGPSSGLSSTGLASGSCWGDFDGDGWLDLYVCNRTGTQNNGGISLVPNHLYKNKGNGTFEDVAPALGLDDAWMSFQPAFVDIDLDGDLDLYVANDRGGIAGARNRLFRNDGGTFTEISQLSDAGLEMCGMGSAVSDFDRDGDFDIYVTNTIGGHAYLRNDGGNIFTESATPLGIQANLDGWGCTFLDFDHDGWEELYVLHHAAPNHLYRHAGAWPAVEIGGPLGVLGPGYGQGNIGIDYCHAQGDVDGDGDVDLLVHSWNWPLGLYINHEGETRNHLRLRLRQSGGNRFAIGATVEIRVAGVIQRKPVVAGTGHRSSSELTLDFGLDAAMVVDTVLVRWPDGALSRLTAVAANQVVTVDRDVVGSIADCDRDFVPDDEQIALDPSLDQDGDGWIDSCTPIFLRSDANGDGVVDIGDPIFALGYLFSTVSSPCPDAIDANDDGAVDIADPIQTLGRLFGAVTAASPYCASDSTADSLACDALPQGCAP